MKIVVVGDPGFTGSQVVALLRGSGHEAVPASPSTGVDALTGGGLTQAVKGADVVVDVSNSPSFETEAALDFFTRSGQHVIEAEKEAVAAGPPPALRRRRHRPDGRRRHGRRRAPGRISRPAVTARRPHAPWRAARWRS